MEKTYFPGYSKCVACRDMISDKDIKNHKLNCRPKFSSNNKQNDSLQSNLFSNENNSNHNNQCDETSTIQVFYYLILI